MIPFDLPPKPTIWTPPKPAIIRAASMKDIAPHLAMPMMATFAAGSVRGFRRASARTVTLVADGEGTAIGDLNQGGTLGNAFNGTTSSALADSAWKLSGSSSGYVGKTWSAAKIFSDATCYPPNNTSWTNNGSGNVTLNLRGKNGTAPSSAADGTIIGTTGVFADSTATRTITSTDTSTAWDHWILEIISATTNEIGCAELDWNELV